MDIHKVMDLAKCAYCGWPGLVMSVKLSPNGFDVTGKCQVCGYTYDSLYLPTGIEADLPSDVTRPRERLAQD